MVKLYSKQDLKIIAANVDKSHNDVKHFLNETPANFTIAYDPDGKLAQQFKLKRMPTAYLIGKNGEIKATHVSFREKNCKKIEASIENELTTR